MNTKPEDRTYSWIKRECTVAQGLYGKVIEELDPEDVDLKDIIPDPITYVRNRDHYKSWWDAYKESQCEAFRQKHKSTIAELEKEKEENIKKLQMTEDEKLEYYVQKEKEIAEKRERGEEIFFEPPQDYIDDQKAIRGFFNSTMAVYMDLMSTILSLLGTEEFGFIKMDLSDANEAKEESQLQNRLINTLAPYENYYFYEKAQSNEKCNKCD